MISRGKSSERRRRFVPRRLFLFTAFLPISLPAVTLGGAARQPQGPAATVLTRQVRLTRDAAGDYRVFESLSVSLGDPVGWAASDSAPLALIMLPIVADGFRMLGGDLAPVQVGLERSRLTVVGPIASEPFQILFMYRLPATARTVGLGAEVPVEELVLEIEKGSVDARVGGAFTREADVGPPTRPYRSYVARQLRSNEVPSIELLNRGTDGRQRFAVLVATALAASAAAAYIWRRGARSPQGAGL